MSDGSCPEMSGKPGHAAGAAGVGSRRDKALEALLSEPTLARAAVAAGVNERTLRRWVREPRFRAAWREARRDAFGQAISLTQRYAPLAVATLVKVMNDNAASPAAKVTAAAVMLKFAREGIELDDLAERVDALERGIAPLVVDPRAEQTPPDDTQEES